MIKRCTSKAAVNAFTESVALELAPFSVRMRLALPGRALAIHFGDNARQRMVASGHAAYAELMERVFITLRDDSTPITQARDVAEAAWRAVTDPGAPMRIPAGAGAVAAAAEA